MPVLHPFKIARLKFIGYSVAHGLGPTCGVFPWIFLFSLTYNLDSRSKTSNLTQVFRLPGLS